MHIAKKIRRVVAETALVYSLALANAAETGYSGVIDWHPVHKAATQEYKNSMIGSAIREAELEDYLDSVVAKKNSENFVEAMKTNPSKLMASMERDVERRYSERKGFYNSLEKALGLERKQINYARRVFSKRDIPEKYAAAIAIVESGLKPKVVSRKKAVGVYQFIASTIKKHDKNSVNEFQDVRFNPIISAEFAAEELKGCFQNFGDWNLALARYNSSMPERYLEERENPESSVLSLEGYVKYLGEKVEAEPRLLKYAWENLDYIAKISFMAKTLEESYSEIFKDKGEDLFKIYTMKNPSQDIEIIIRKGENLRTAVRRVLKGTYGFTTTQGTNWVISYIEKSGKIININRVSPGQEFVVPGPQNLGELEQRFGQNLRKYNLHIINPDEMLGNETRIVVPAEQPKRK